MLTIVRSRAQGDSKEPRTRRVLAKSPCKSKMQTRVQMLEKAREILRDAAPSRIRRVVNDKVTIRPWTGKELDEVLKKGHLVHRKRELATLPPDEVRRLCVKELLREGFLVRNKWGEYEIASELIAQAS